MASFLGIFEKEVIGPASDPYLTRIHLTPKWLPLSWGFYLHVFHRPDAEPHLHDHPRKLRSFVLRGGYVEERGRLALALDERGAVKLPAEFVLEKTLIERKRGSVVDLPLDTKHRIVRLTHDRTLTIVWYCKAKEREWGFWVDDVKVQFVDHETYLNL